VRIQLAANHKRHAAITQHLHLADDGAHKQRLLAHYLACENLAQAVVFTATKRGADRLAKALAAKGHACAALHGDMNQGSRRRTVERLQRGELRVLVATDVAARGLDVRGITHVINFDLPMVPEDYIHRIGRTGRAGAPGTAITLAGPDDRAKLAGIERLIGGRLERSVVPGLEPMFGETPRTPRSRPDARHARRRGETGRTAASSKREPWRGGMKTGQRRDDERRRVAAGRAPHYRDGRPLAAGGGGGQRMPQSDDPTLG
jgi:superfamily II DNA/RNA helicase